MKILYSEIKKLIPKLKARPKEIGEILTMTGFMMDSFEEITYRNNKDYLIGLEVRQNRADCLSIIGIAREIAAYYGLEVEIQEPAQFHYPDNGLDIEVDAENYVKRILALRISNLKNQESPQWLKEFLNFYEMNSINLLVDLSNYVMILTGYPSHLIDVQKMRGNLKWKINQDFDKIITLDGSKIELSKNNELIMQDDEKIIAIAGIVGGKNADIHMDTTDIIVELATYQRSIIRKNSRDLKIVTQASQRLEKDLDPNGQDYAIKLLTGLIIKYCSGEIKTKIFDYYPRKKTYPKIKFNLNLPSSFAGIEIKKEKVREILKNLGFKSENIDEDNIFLTAPIGRMDIELEEDAIEEVIRIFGYQNINADSPLFEEVTKNITPRHIKLSEKIRDVLVSLGFDEILSLPLTKIGENEKSNYLNWKIIETKNSVNENYPQLRQTMAPGLLNQVIEFEKKNIERMRLFEIGKIFGKKNGKYSEYDSLGILIKSNDIKKAKETIEKLLRTLGFSEIFYCKNEKVPEIANPFSFWDIFVKDKRIAVLYKLRERTNTYFTELNISKISDLLGKINNNPTVELTHKLVSLDANIETNKDENIYKYIERLRQSIRKENIWSIEIKDVFNLEDRTKYTIRVVYKELTDQEAKKIHKKIFK